MCEFCILPQDGTPGREGPFALVPPLPPPGPVQAAIIGLAGSELHYLPWPAPAPGGPWRLQAGETGHREGDVLNIPRRVGMTSGLACLRHVVAKGSHPTVPTLAPRPQSTPGSVPGCPLLHGSQHAF